MKRYLLFSFLALFFFTGSAHALDLEGVQPLAPYGVFSTFSAESLPKGKFDVAFQFEKCRHPDFYRYTAQFGYGISDSIEFGMTVPLHNEPHNTASFEDIGFALKYRFVDEGKYGPSVAFILTATAPVGSDEFSTEGSVGAGIAVTKKVGPVLGHVNVFYSKPFTDRFNDDITFAGGIDFSATHAFKILGELYGKKSYSGNVDRLEVRGGVRFLTTENLFTTFGVGWDLKNRTPEYRLMFSVSYLFPSEKKKIKDIEEMED
ncbi:MAG TPA: transporter [Thermodesulfovibrionales bacterium]|nr:transporter [Thermodesulfovibrionales bacterium]